VSASASTADSEVIIELRQLRLNAQEHEEKQQEQARALAMDMSVLKNKFPAGVVSVVVTPSQASARPDAASSLFDTLQLNRQPVVADDKYSLPKDCGDQEKWRFRWAWTEGKKQLEIRKANKGGEAGGSDDDEGNQDDDDNVTEARDIVDSFTKDELEITSYNPVVSFLEGLGLFGRNVGNGQNLPAGNLFNQDIWTLRKEGPDVRSQRVYHRHTVTGRTDVVVLSQDSKGTIDRWMVKFAIEVKTVEGMKKSKTGSKTEAIVQLIGLNASNSARSPPVILTNLAQTHSVLYLDLVREVPVQYSVMEQSCDSFAAAVHFAMDKCEQQITDEFSRPPSPP
jgi:hypothetical protein